MKVELKNGQRFVANFRYNAKPALIEDPLNEKLTSYLDIHSGDYDKFDSVCK